MKSVISFLLVVTTFPAFSGSINVVAPGAGTTRVAEGIDYATYELGDPWDMANIEDVVLRESQDIAGETISGGVYSGTAQTTDPRFWLVYPGLQNAVRVLDNGDKFPINTADYRYLTFKIRYSGTANPQTFDVRFYEDASSLSGGAVSRAAAPLIQPGDWRIVRIDLVTDTVSGPAWTDLSQVRGIRIDPVNGANAVGVTFEIDWVRLTQESTTASEVTVSWNGGGGPYDIDAIDADGEVYTFTNPRPTISNPVAGTSFSAPFSLLPPGNYQVMVRSGGDSGLSPGTVAVNEAPLLHFLNPDVTGDTANSYAITELSNSWATLDAGDIASTPDIINVQYSGGSLSGRTITSDSRIIFNSTVPIDTQKYRMLTYTWELLPGIASLKSGQQKGIGENFSIARILFGNSLPNLTTSEDIVVQPGTNTYPLGDLRSLKLEPGETGTWSGFIDFIRFDPHEIGGDGDTRDPNRNIRLDSFILAPFDSASNDFTFQWVDSDSDDNATITIFADVDKNPNNMNETQLIDGASENGPNSALWTVNIPDGQYEIFARISDGLNETVRYATGPLVIGAGGSLTFAVNQPDGVDDEVVAGTDYFFALKGDRADMSNAADVNFALSNNVSGQSITSGRYSATATNNDPFFFLVSSTDPAINTSAFRFLTVKLRHTGSGQLHPLSVSYCPTAACTPGTLGTALGGVQLPENQWFIVTVDLVAQSAGSSPSWDDQAEVFGLRFDPTNKSGTTFEIDWATLSTGSPGASLYTIDWIADEIDMGSTLSLTLIDDDGARVVVADGLSPTTTQFQADLSQLALGDYVVELNATPGPTELSTGPLSIVEGVVNPDVLYSNGFEAF